MEKKFCTECGAPLGEDTNVCLVCGTQQSNDIIEVTETTENATVTEPSAQVAQVIDRTPEPPVQIPPAAPPVSSASAYLKPPKDSPYAPISTFGFFGIFMLTSIPIVNLIFVIVWACGGCRKIQKQSFARGILLYVLVSIVLTIVAIVAFIVVYKDFFIELLRTIEEAQNAMGMGIAI